MVAGRPHHRVRRCPCSLPSAYMALESPSPMTELAVELSSPAAVYPATGTEMLAAGQVSVGPSISSITMPRSSRP